MILDSIRNKHNYRDFPLLYQALCYLEKLSEDVFSQSSLIVINGHMFCSLVTLMSRPKSECIYESHRKFIDLHYILDGTEGIATADVSTMFPKTPFDLEKDIGFYTGEETAMSFLHAGDFMVRYPNDAHMVAIMDKEPEEIRKIIVKIKVKEG